MCIIVTGSSGDFIYIDDAIDGVLQALEHFNAAEGGTYNIAASAETTVRSLAGKICKLLQSKSEIEIAPDCPGEVARFVADTTLAENAFGFRAKTTFNVLPIDIYR